MPEQLKCCGLTFKDKAALQKRAEEVTPPASRPGASLSATVRKEELAAAARWWGGRVFEVQSRDHRWTFDSSRREGPAAMDGLLASLAACLGSMVAEILDAMHAPFEDVEVQAGSRKRQRARGSSGPSTSRSVSPDSMLRRPSGRSLCGPPPLIIGNVRDVLAHGRVVVKSSTGPDLLVNAADYRGRPIDPRSPRATRIGNA